MSCSSTQIAAMEREKNIYETIREDIIRRNEACLRSMGFGSEFEKYRSSLSSSGSYTGDFNYYDTIREDNKRRNEMHMSHLGFASADNGRSSSSSGFVFCFFVF